MLDALPVHKIGWDAARRQWFEWGVGLEGTGFGWRRLPSATFDEAAAFAGIPCEAQRPLCGLPNELLDQLPDGFTTEICPAALQWWRGAAEALRRGRLLTIDYGLEADQFFAPERISGSLRSYSHHQVSSDILAQPGLQDITAPVNFTAVRSVGAGMGLQTETFMTQEQFLNRVVERVVESRTPFADWDGRRARELQTLTHPEHLGRRFSVLVQSRDAG